jgi:methylenetetrahydrofolate--tRNA-(uracil-5-)-methyltransferase
LLRLAYENRVPSGASLSVDRYQFSAAVTQTVSEAANLKVLRTEIDSIPEDGIVILATGPLTSEALSASIREFAGENHLYFYDAISPIVDADSINLDRVYRASRYDKGDADYLNCPFTREEYLRFYDALVQAESVPLHECENAAYFEACLPIEEMAKRGVDTLRFGPMKPVGLKDPKTGRLPYAAIQLRQENLRADSYNLVGFQNHLRFGEQERIFRLIPGLENANFTRLGQIHRNTFINSPRLLLPTLQSRKNPRIFFAGQICGVEGYVECIATGLIAGINAVRLVSGQEPVTPPRETAIGSLLHYLGSAEPDRFQPENINFGIMPPPNLSAGEKRLGKREKHLLQTKYALQAMKEFADFLNPVSLPH